MGHSNDDTVMYYISGIVGVDSQSMVHGRDQRSALIDENTSMMSKRNLLAPMPPGSQLTDRPTMAIPTRYDRPVAVVTISERTPSKEYSLRRQSRTVAFRKKREEFFEGNVTTPQQTTKLTSQQTVSNPSRSPSRYLEALWKFEPERKAIVELMYPNMTADEVSAKDGHGASSDSETPLNNILGPMVGLANPKKKRYAYASAEPTEDHRCGVCDRQFTKTYVAIWL